MPFRSQERRPAPAAVEPSRFEPGIALRKTFRDGYGKAELKADVLAGLVVGVVALPLSMALAIASGVPPQYGLYTAIVAGLVIAPLGGSRVQVSGPTAAFVVVLAPIAARFGVGGLLLATLMAGAILVGLGLARMGRLIEFVPNPVTTGFTAGIGVVIATLQLKDFLGLEVEEMPESYLGKVGAMMRALPTAHGDEITIGVATLAILVLWPRLTRKLPAPLVALTAGALVAVALGRLVPGFEVATIESRFSYTLDGVVRAGIPQIPPLPGLPWSFPGADGAPLGLSLDTVRALLPSAFAIAMLGAIESLLCAVVADGMIRRQHDPDVELFAQGVGNLVAPFFGGIAATGAIARTATSVRAGGRSPFAAMVHSVFVLAAVLLLAPLLGHLPMASLAAMLLVVAWNMSEARHAIRTVQTAPRSDVLVLLACFGLTVVFDMVVSVTFGVMLAALLFMRRMAAVAGTSLVSEPHRRLRHQLPPEVLLYEVVGPLFFGAAQRAMGALQRVDAGVKAVVLDLRSVPVIDATGLVNLESAIERLTHTGVFVALAGVGGQPLHALVKAGWRSRKGEVAVCRSFDVAIERARRHVEAAKKGEKPGAGPPAVNGATS